MKNWLIWKDPDAGKDWRWEEKGTSEDKLVGWHHWLDGHEFEQALGVVDGQGSLACCSPWGRKESDTTEQLNWTEEMGRLRNALYVVKNRGSMNFICACFLFCFSLYFLNYESMITHLQKTWKIQNKVAYSSTIYYNYFFKVDKLRFLVESLYQTLKN